MLVCVFAFSDDHARVPAVVVPPPMTVAMPQKTHHTTLTTSVNSTVHATMQVFLAALCTREALGFVEGLPAYSQREMVWGSTPWSMFAGEVCWSVLFYYCIPLVCFSVWLTMFFFGSTCTGTSLTGQSLPAPVSARVRACARACTKTYIHFTCKNVRVYIRMHACMYVCTCMDIACMAAGVSRLHRLRLGARVGYSRASKHRRRAAPHAVCGRRVLGAYGRITAKIV